MKGMFSPNGGKTMLSKIKKSVTRVKLISPITILSLELGGRMKEVIVIKTITAIKI